MNKSDDFNMTKELLEFRRRHGSTQQPFSAARSSTGTPEVSNEDILAALMTMAEGINQLVREAIAAELGNAHGPEKPMVKPEASSGGHSIEDLRRDLTEMQQHISNTKVEIAALRPAEGSRDQFVSATNELDEVISSTERATNEILAATEGIQEIVEKMRENQATGATAQLDSHIDELDAKSLEILMACGFQDLTGQRISKVVNTLLYMERRVAAMVEI